MSMTEIDQRKQMRKAAERKAMTRAVGIIAKHLGARTSHVRRSVRCVENALAILDRLGYDDQATVIRFEMAMNSSPSHLTRVDDPR
ncbi:hypothetical protein UFOVP1387_50 [uncultured Caudovirales phage]|uniref:Uncharacterized protein n=1 Tax=uncultured Caudovirales phage TaxID=2100421 RepID=A0A6J5S6S8_9CAUD|nr:hypothetical protein UFOVP1387_50 [uncultured Caudovirales phage]